MDKIVGPKVMFIVVILLTYLTPALSDTKQLGLESAQKLAATLDYIASDYTEAVAVEGGKIIHEGEYQEMKRFIKSAYGYCRDLGLKKDDTSYLYLKGLEEAVAKKFPAAKVVALASQTRDAVIDLFAIPTAPQKMPDTARGQRLYNELCTSCHGADGRAQTELATSFDPPPFAFADEAQLDKLSPFKAFNALTFGVEGTPMASFNTLSEEDRWNIAAYLFSFRNNDDPPSLDSDPIVHWKVAMALSDQGLLMKLMDSGFNEERANKERSQVRSLHYISEKPLLTTVEAYDPIPMKVQPRLMLDYVWKKTEIMLGESGPNPERSRRLLSEIDVHGFPRMYQILGILGFNQDANRLKSAWNELRKSLKKNAALESAQEVLFQSLREARVHLLAKRSMRPFKLLLNSMSTFFIKMANLFVFVGLILLSMNALTGRNRLNAGVLISGVFVAAGSFVLLPSVHAGPFLNGVYGILACPWFFTLTGVAIFYVSKVYGSFFNKIVRSKPGWILSYFSMFLAATVTSFEILRLKTELSLQMINKDVWINGGLFAAAMTLFLLVAAGSWGYRRYPEVADRLWILKAKEGVLE